MVLSLFSRQQGAIPPPPGVSTNFVNPPNRDTEIHAVSAVCITISTVSIVARTYTRLFIMKRRGWEDYLLWTAWLLSIVYMLMAPLGIPYGAGVHLWDVPTPIYLEFLMRSNITDIFYSPVICMVKLAILIQLLHIFAPSRTRLYWTIMALSTLTIMFYFSCMIFRIFACVPRKKIWNPDIPGTCINSGVGILTSAVINVISDFVLLLLPMIKIWQLQMPRHKKWAVSSVFATGLFGCIASILRLVASVNILQSDDVTYELIDIGLWCDAEITSGIVCCCLPPLPQLYRVHMSSFVASLQSCLFSAKADSTGAVSYSASNMADARFLRSGQKYVELQETVFSKVPRPSGGAGHNDSWNENSENWY